MSLLETILGRPLASSEASKEKLTVPTGVPVLGFDALSSVAYGPEAALTVLVALSAPGLAYLPKITLAILILLAMLFLSYLQTIGAYPNGGGSYTVAKENLGREAGLCAAAALLLDYILNVAVGISAGIGALVSALPALHPYTLLLCLLAVLVLTMVNLRGVRESGLVFELPAVSFAGCVGAAVVIGIIRAMHSQGHPQSMIPLPPLSPDAQGISLWLILRAFANGCTAMTGVEAVSNGVPLFKDPKVLNARMTLTVIVVLLGVLLLGTAYLCPAYQIGAMDQSQPGYQTTLSLLVGAVAGHGAFYYAAMASILIMLTFSANTSFADFPRVCRLLARDGFMPRSFAERGSRLVFSAGILALAILSSLILIAFGGITEKLIPLFAVGAFSAFTLSQAGMVVHWARKEGSAARSSLVVNALGAGATGVTLLIIIVAKFLEGAWITLLIVPALIVLFHRIQRHYARIDRDVGRIGELRAPGPGRPVVIIPIQGWNRLAERALRVAMEISDDITAVHIKTEDREDDDKGGQKSNDDDDEPDDADDGADDDADGANLRREWAENVEAPARAASSLKDHQVALSRGPATVCRICKEGDRSCAGPADYGPGPGAG